MIRLEVGDVIKLKSKYYEGGTAIVIHVNRATSSGFPGNDGWISFDYQVLTENNEMIHISDDCVDQIVSRFEFTFS